MVSRGCELGAAALPLMPAAPSSIRSSMGVDGNGALGRHEAWPEAPGIAKADLPHPDPAPRGAWRGADPRRRARLGPSHDLRSRCR